MTLDTELWEQERKFWLDDAEVMSSRMADGAVMVMPYPAGILQGETIGEKKKAAPKWDDVTFADQTCRQHGTTAVLAYKATAHAGDTRYEALCVSTYIDDEGEWRLISHQETPA